MYSKNQGYCGLAAGGETTEREKGRDDVMRGGGWGVGRIVQTGRTSIGVLSAKKVSWGGGARKGGVRIRKRSRRIVMKSRIGIKVTPTSGVVGRWWGPLEG